MMASPCAMPAVSTTNSTEWTGWQNKSELHCDFTRRKERVSQNEEIKEAAISTITIPGRSRCARTEFKRERESQRAKKGAADPRKKSKLKVCSCYFFLISYFYFLRGFSLGILIRVCFQWPPSVWSIRCLSLVFSSFWPSVPPCTANSYHSVCNGLKFSTSGSPKKQNKSILFLTPPKLFLAFLSQI